MTLPTTPTTMQGAAPARGRREPAGPWRWKHLLWAPHRLAFFWALVVLLASGVWWALVQLDRASGAVGLGYAVSPTVTHAAVMVMGFFPLFFAGFLFTAGPKWLGVEGPSARAILSAVLLQAGGWLLWLLGAHVHAWLTVMGLALVLAGQALQNTRFWWLVRASRQVDRLHATVVALAGTFGVLCLTALLVALLTERLDLARVAVLSALWGFVVPTYLAVAHRMIPFFTSSAVPMVQAWRPFWVLWFLLATAALQLASVWLEALGLGQQVFVQAALGLVEIIAGAVVLWLGVVWGLVQSLKIRLLAMLHLGFVWLGLSLLLAGVARWMGLIEGLPAFGLGALHALSMGFLGSILLAMVTRVACGHSGRTLVADGLVWSLFWLLQLAVLLRIIGTLPLASPWVLSASGALWAGLMGVWGVRLTGWFARPRVDGRPG